MMVVMMGVMCVGCGYTYKEGDFSLAISVDKTEAQVGETVTVTVVFENLSGRKHSIHRKKRLKNVNDIINIGLHTEDVDWGFVYTDEHVSWYALKMKTLKKGKTITIEKEFQIEESKNYETAAAVMFYIGRNYKKPIYIETDRITIHVTEGR